LRGRKFAGHVARVLVDDALPQQLFDETDCAVACLRMVARLYGRDVSATFIRARSGNDTHGTTLRGICAAAESMGFTADAVKVSRDRVDGLRLPAIIHWRARHWVVLYEVRGDRVVIGDPNHGIRAMSREELSRSGTVSPRSCAPQMRSIMRPPTTARCPGSCRYSGRAGRN
jgi:ABC-type bacteriocin/lantibiotic exporter with double-glycine peptidase domain